VWPSADEMVMHAIAALGAGAGAGAGAGVDITIIPAAVHRRMHLSKFAAR
jgi:hypothetical protein